MAYIYKGINGRKMTKVIAANDGVQRALDRIAGKETAIAAAILKTHRDSGDSRVYMESGRVDRYVVLDDERGLLAALAILRGRPHEGGRTEPVPVFEHMGVK